jgi:hypothetical protein
MKVSDITSRARILLNDQDGTRWLDNELISWLNDAQKLVALTRPDSSVSNSTMTLVSGTKQTLPGAGFRLLDVMRNIAVDGVTGGRSIRAVDREVLDSQDPSWHTGTQSGTIKHFIYDNRNPLVFYVYPPASAGTKIEIMYSVAPTEIVYNPANVAATLAIDLAISDIYLEAILNYVMYRAYSKDAEFSQNPQLAAGYLQTVYSMLGIKTQKDVAFSPDLNSKGAMPNAAALQAGGV